MVAWEKYALPVAKHFWGEPTRKTGTETFWGTQQARKVNAETAQWYDHELAVGGGVADLIRHFEPAANPAEWLRDNLGAEIEDGAAGDSFKLRPLPTAPRVTHYEYLRADGSLHLRVKRIDKGDGSKTFSQALPDGRSPKHDPDYKTIPYRLDRITAQAAADIYICEGEKACAALEACGLLATTNPGGSGNWGEHLQQYFTGRRIFVLPDNDAAGELHGGKVMQNLCGTNNVKLLRLPGLVLKGDAHDWLEAGGTRQQLIELSDAALEATHDELELQPVALPLRALSLSQLLERPAASWCIDGVLPRACTAAIWGAPGSFKTFLALDMMLHIAHGREWNGRDVEQALVVYVAGEGVGGLRKRVAAWHSHYKLQVADAQFILIEEAVPLDAGGAEALVETVEALRDGRHVEAIVYDTLARCMTGDENSTADMSAAIRAVDQVRLNFEASSTILVHHQGKSEGKALRGSSALHGALDTSLQVRKHDTHAEVLQHKQKDAEELQPIWFEMRRVEFQVHCLDDISNSLVPALVPNAPIKGGASKLLESLDAALISWGRDDFAGVNGISCLLEEWREAADSVAACGGGTPDSQQKAWRRGLDQLQKSGAVALHAGRVRKVTA